MQNMLIEKCRSFMPLSRTNINMLNSETSEMIHFHKFSTPKFIEEEFTRNAFKLLIKYNLIKKNQTVLFKDRLKMSYLIIIKEKIQISLGPFIDESIKQDDIKFIGHSMKLTSENILILQNYFTKIPIITYDEASYIAKIFRSIIDNNLDDTEIIKDIIRSKLPKENKYSNKFEQYDFVEQNYKKENEILHYIEKGDVDSLASLLELEYDQINIPSRNKYDPLRDTKNLAITSNSISARAAIRGGLNVHLAHSISTKYAIEIEKQTTVDAVMKLANELIIEYTQCVRDYSLEKFSPLIKDALIIIRKNITSQINLKSIASLLHTSNEHLSREFKKEMGKNITDYINELKIKESLDLVKSKKYSISDIAYIFGYSSSSYYSTVFKKIIGVSPVSYR